MQENQATTDQMVARSRDAVREVGTLEAIFADSGLSGNSQERVLADAERAASEDITTLGRNRYLRIEQGHAELAASRAAAQSRTNSTPRPSLIGAGLNAAGVLVERRLREPKQ